MDRISFYVTGGWEPVSEQSVSSDHGAMLSTSAMVLVISDIQFTVSSLLSRTPYLDKASVPPRNLLSM
jgi:hypothetical protein